MCLDRSSYTTVNANFPVNLENVIVTIRGMMYTTCVWPVPLATVNADFPVNLEKGTVIIKGSMYKHCL